MEISLSIPIVAQVLEVIVALKELEVLHKIMLMSGPELQLRAKSGSRVY